MRLLEPFTLTNLALPNRAVMASLTRRRAGPGHLATPLMGEYYAQRAGAGLILSERIEVDPALAGNGQAGAPTAPALFNLAQARAWRAVVAQVHAAGGRIFAQLSHAGRISHPALRGGLAPVAPSARAAAGRIFTPAGEAPLPVPRALTLAEIAGLVEQFAEAAAYARGAGFDGVEIDAAHGLLIDQFLRSGSNLRSDAYGGSARARVRFLLEVTEAVADIWGVGRVGVRLSPWSGCHGMRDALPRDTFTHAAAALDQLGVAFLHLVEQPGRRPSALASLRGHFGGAVIAAGGYTRESAEAVLATGLADCVAFGSSFLANPDLPERFRRSAPLNPPDPATFLAGGARGYTDYPSLHS